MIRKVTSRRNAQRLHGAFHLRNRLQMNRHPNIARALLAGVFAALAAAANAQGYPSKTVRIIGPFVAGGGGDILARMIAQRLNEAHGQHFIVENRPGATGTIAAAFVAKSPPDGHALILHSQSTFLAGFMYRSVPYHPLKSFAPVVNCVNMPLYLVTSPSLPAKTPVELVALAKKHPGQVTSGSPGVGSAGHLTIELFNSVAGTKIVHVPFKGSAPAMTAAASGDISVVVTTILSGEQFVRIGKLRALAVTGATRSPSVPAVPTLLEFGLAVEVNHWTGAFTTAGTPPAVVNQLNASLGRILAAPDMTEWLAKSYGGDFAANTPDQFTAVVTADVARWQKVIKDIGVVLD
jgi:tripartite-type tricarboxylate transporter receptor subunit TctC